MFTRKVAVDRQRCLHDSGRGVGEPDASRDTQGMNRLCTTLDQASITASLNTSARRGHEPCASGLLRHLLLLRLRWRELPPVDVCCASPEPEAHWRTVTVSPVVCRGRYEGTARFLGRRAHLDRSLPSSLARRENLHTCVVQPRVRCTSIRKSRQDRLPSDNCAKIKRREKKDKNPLSGVVDPLTTGDLIRVRRQTLTALALTSASTPSDRINCGMGDRGIEKAPGPLPGQTD